eukprot:UN09975
MNNNINFIADIDDIDNIIHIKTIHDYNNLKNIIVLKILILVHKQQNIRYILLYNN